LELILGLIVDFVSLLQLGEYFIGLLGLLDLAHELLVKLNLGNLLVLFVLRFFALPDAQSVRFCLLQVLFLLLQSNLLHVEGGNGLFLILKRRLPVFGNGNGPRIDSLNERAFLHLLRRVELLLDHFDGGLGVLGLVEADLLVDVFDVQGSLEGVGKVAGSDYFPELFILELPDPLNLLPYLCESLDGSLGLGENVLIFVQMQGLVLSARVVFGDVFVAAGVLGA